MGYSHTCWTVIGTYRIWPLLSNLHQTHPQRTGRLMSASILSRISDVMGLIGSFMDLIGLGEVTGVDVLFAAMAIIGTFLFLIYFILILIGGVADGAMDMLPGDVDMDIGAEGIFHVLTIQGLLSFVMMFGIFGLAVSQTDQNAFVAIVAGTVAGSISMYIIGKVFQLMKSLEMDNTVKFSEAIGAKGTVYRTINAGEHGQVQVEYQGALRTSDAVAEDENLVIKTGKFIQVIHAIGETLIVKPLDITVKPEEE